MGDGLTEWDIIMLLIMGYLYLYSYIIIIHIYYVYSNNWLTSYKSYISMSLHDFLINTVYSILKN